MKNKSFAVIGLGQFGMTLAMDAGRVELRCPCH